MPNQAACAVSRSMFLVLAVVVVVVLVVGCGGEEPADPPTPGAAPRVVEPAPTAAATASVAQLPRTRTPVDAPTPTQVAAEPEATAVVDPTPAATPAGVLPSPRPGAPGVDLNDTQVVTAPGRMRSNMAPWRDDGGNRLFSTHVFGTPFMLNEKGEVLPWLATGITSNDDFTVWTMKLREDAVFQDGTPITASDFKAYWEYGAKPENRVAWGGASITLREIRGWQGLIRGDAAEASGLRVVNDHTLEIETAVELAAWPLYMAAWHVGISKLDQVLADEHWGNAPIGAGPFSLTYDPESGLTELTRVDLAGKHWNGPHDTPIIEKLVLPNIEDEQARLVMFENGELDVMSIGRETFVAALDPGHPFNPLLYVSPYGGLWLIDMKFDYAPLEDPLVRRALAHAVDMEKIVSAVWGPSATHAKGVMSSQMRCHNADADYQQYDPDLARKALSQSAYGSADNLPQLMIDLRRSDMIDMGKMLKAYWQDDLGIDLDILKQESGQPRREESQFRRLSLGSWIPDPSQIASTLYDLYDSHRYYPGGSRRFVPRRTDAAVLASHPLALSGYPVLLALFGHALSLPLDDPERCEAFQAFEEEYVDKVYAIPIREVDPIRWVVQPWLRGFQSTFNLDFNTLTTAYVVKH